MKDALIASPFSADLLPEVQSFSYGTEPWEAEVGVWLCNESLRRMQEGTEVWLYMNQANQIVGFGSLGTSNWSIPKKKSPRQSVLVIPALGIRMGFKGEPSDERSAEVANDGRYSSQIMRHLVQRSRGWPEKKQFLGLCVHPENSRAVGFYAKFGSELLDYGWTDQETKVCYGRYVIPLHRGN